MKIGIVFPPAQLAGDVEAGIRLGLAVEELGHDHLHMCTTSIARIRTSTSSPS